MDDLKTFEEGAASNAAHNNANFCQGDDLDKENVLKNLQIAHEIALNSKDGDVHIEDFEVKNELWSAVREQVHSAFWDIFREEISKDPPELTMAFLLLKDIKESLFAVMTPNIVKLKANVEEVLDLELLKQQAEHGAMNVQSYAQYVISVMSKICAPVRDANMVNLSKETDIVAIFRGILETLNLMKLDLINFTLKSITPDILSNQMEYEKKKFADYIELLGGNLPITDAWVRKHKNEGGNITQDEILYNAFLEILNWKSDSPLPETLFMDAPRLSILKREYYKLVIASSIVIVSLSCSSPDLVSDASYKQALKTNVSILLNGITTDETLDKIIPNIIEQIKQDANLRLSSMGKEKLNESASNTLEQQIKDVVLPSNKIRMLVCKRIDDYLKSSLNAVRGNGPFPPALHLFQNELEDLNSKFKHVAHHNMKVCGSYYYKILQELD